MSGLPVRSATRTRLLGVAVVVVAALTLAATVSTLAATVSTTAAADTGRAPSPTAERAFSDLAGCVAVGKPLYVQFVVDESQSLESSDPQAQRRLALLDALDMLADLAAHGAAVHAAAATFATNYIERVPWAGLTTSHLAGLQAFAADTAGLHSGQHTDYREALDGAMSSLRSAAEGAAACEAVLWFTDGALDVGGGVSANDAARRELCEPNGIVDGIRRQGIYLLAIGLVPPTGTSAVTPRDRARLQATAEGSGPGASCGTVPLPATATPGAYLSAQDADQLRTLFECVVERLAGYTPDAVGCPLPQPVTGRLGIPVDPGIRSVRLVVFPHAGAHLELAGPRGDTVSLSEGRVARAELSSATVLSRADAGVVRVEVDTAAEPAHGTWVLWVVGPRSAGAAVEVYRSSGLALRFKPSAPSITAGAPFSYRVAVVDNTGAAADPKVWRTFRLTARVDQHPTPPLQGAGDEWTGTLAVPAHQFPPSLSMTVTLELVSKPTGNALTPITLQSVLPVRPPASFPRVAPADLALPAIVGAGSTQGRLQLIGSQEGPTSVCVRSTSFAKPAGVRAVSLERGTGCVRLRRGERRDLDVTVTTTGAADGIVDGSFRATLGGVRPSDVATVDIPVHFAVSRPVAEAVRWALVALLVALSLLLPLLVLWLLGRRTARLRYDTVKVASVPVLLTAEGPRRTANGEPCRLNWDDFRFRPPPEGVMRYDIGDVQLHSVARARTLFQPQAYVEASGRAIATSHDPYPTRLGTAAAELGANSMWMLVIDDLAELAKIHNSTARWEVPGVIHALRREGLESLQQVQQSLADFEHWERLVQQLARLAHSAQSAAKPVSTPGGDDPKQAHKHDPTSPFTDPNYGGR